MDLIRIGVIGGSGLYQMRELADVEEREIATPYGAPSGPIVVGTLNGVRVAFLARHGPGHRHTPSQVPYRANIYALKVLGVRQLVAVSACGSLRDELRPGEFLVPDQVFDHTKLRINTFFGAGLAAHISVDEPFCIWLGKQLADAVAGAGGRVHLGGKLITIEGPRFSTKAESNAYRAWGMDVINMTTCPEAFLAREAEMCYAVVNAISDYDVWHESEEPVTVERVIELLRRNAELAQLAIADLVVGLASRQDASVCSCQSALGQALITQRDQIPVKTLERLGPLVSRYFT